MRCAMLIPLSLAYVHLLLSYRLPSMDPTFLGQQGVTADELKTDLAALVPFLVDPKSTVRYESVRQAWTAVWENLQAMMLVRAQHDFRGHRRLFVLDSPVVRNPGHTAKLSRPPSIDPCAKTAPSAHNDRPSAPPSCHLRPVLSVQRRAGRPGSSEISFLRGGLAAHAEKRVVGGQEGDGEGSREVAGRSRGR